VRSDVEAGRDGFWMPRGCEAAVTGPTFVVNGFFPPTFPPAPTVSVLVTFVTSPRAARFRVPAAPLRVAVDFFTWRPFFGTSAADSLEPNAAFARVMRVVAAFSSFSLVTARCRRDRT
jgi:hypothetical protein